jgi:hypothetical protein
MAHLNIGDDSMMAAPRLKPKAWSASAQRCRVPARFSSGMARIT